MQTLVNIRKASQEEKIPMDLLLLADPSEAMIRSYLPGTEILMAEAGDLIAAVCVICRLNETEAEIKNIAVKETLQGHGIGRRLLRAAIARTKEMGFINLIIGTGDTSLHQLSFYQSEGFVISDTLQGFFLNNYEDPIFENGVRVKDMIILRLDLSR